MKQYKLMLGDNMASLKKLPDNSIDSVVTDPPYGLSFMNKKWDYDVPSVEFWKEVYRVLKPGGHILSFGGTRTYHRMVVNIEDAGFEIRDQIMWIYGSGFPKSLNVGKAVDKIQGNKREVVGVEKIYETHHIPTEKENNWQVKDIDITKGNSQYEGYGTALKPAQEIICVAKKPEDTALNLKLKDIQQHFAAENVTNKVKNLDSQNEPICVARKPLSEKTVAANMMKWGTGGINVDGCRIETSKDELEFLTKRSGVGGHQDDIVGGTSLNNYKYEANSEGRFPANIIFECTCDEVIKGKEIKGNENYNFNNVDLKETNTFKGRGKYTPRTETPNIHTDPNCPCYQLDQQSGTLKSGELKIGHKRGSGSTSYDGGGGVIRKNYGGDKGGASRFFYVAKVSKKERNMGLDEFEDKTTKIFGEGVNKISGKISGNQEEPKKNFHPTVKPINLMTYLIRLVTPENGIILEPFMGSGSTGIAAMLEGRRFVGMEMDEDYFKIAEKRIESWEQYKKIQK